MVILNFYGKIPSICISEKLKIYISNLPNEEGNNWNQELIEEMHREIEERKLDQNQYGEYVQLYDLKEVHRINFSSEMLPQNPSELDYLKAIADNLIYIYFDYDYEDMPFFDWTTNCFDGRLCEEDYTEKIIKFLLLVTRESGRGFEVWGKFCPTCIYSTNHESQRFLLNILSSKAPNDTKTYIEILKKWGKLLDDFLTTENNYYKLDYLINSIYNDNEYHIYHLFKIFSPFEMLLVKNTEKGSPAELDRKLPAFLYEYYSDEEKIELATIIRKMRNKVGHGDFLGLNRLLEDYAQKFMDNSFSFDYAEYSRQNWIVGHLCCELDGILAKILFMMFTDKERFEAIRELND